MSSYKILQKAIAKALENGFVKDGFMGYPIVTRLEVPKPNQADRHLFITVGTLAMPYEALIFNHDFAKALWGWGTKKCECCGGKPAHLHQCPYRDAMSPALWRYHLQQMVVADDPIAYLGEHLASDQQQNKETN